MDPLSSISLLNGVPSDLIPVMDRGFAYGHGVFETIRVWQARANLLNYHLDRLNCGMRRLQIPVAMETVEQQFRQLLAMAAQRQLREGVAKITVTAGVGGRGYAQPTQASPNIIMQWHPLPQVSEVAVREGVRVKLCNYRLPKNPVLAGIKHLNRLDQVLARAEVDDDFQEGILLDWNDRVIECVSSNVFVRIGDRLLTPTLENCGVAGVMRRLIIEKLCPESGLLSEQQNITLDQLKQASEVFICNSLCGIFPVFEIFPLVSLPLGGWTRHLQNALKKELPCYEI